MRVWSRSCVAALASSLILWGFATTAASQAATTACGAACVTPFSELYGSSEVPAVKGGVAAAGTPIVLARASSGNADEDFTVDLQGTVTQLAQDGYVSATFASLFGEASAQELDYAPGGVASGLCIGVPATARNGTRVALEPCRAADTIWAYYAGAGGLGPGTDSALISAVSPVTATSVTVEALTDFLPGGQLFTWKQLGVNKILPGLPNQLWSELSGPLP